MGNQEEMNTADGMTEGSIWRWEGKLTPQTRIYFTASRKLEESSTLSEIITATNGGALRWWAKNK